MRNLPPLLNKDKNECPRTLPEEWLVETLSPGGRPPPRGQAVAPGQWAGTLRPGCSWTLVTMDASPSPTADSVSRGGSRLASRACN